MKFTFPFLLLLSSPVLSFSKHPIISHNRMAVIRRGSSNQLGLLSLNSEGGLVGDLLGSGDGNGSGSSSDSTGDSSSSTTDGLISGKAVTNSSDNGNDNNGVVGGLVSGVGGLLTGDGNGATSATSSGTTTSQAATTTTTQTQQSTTTTQTTTQATTTTTTTNSQQSQQSSSASTTPSTTSVSSTPSSSSSSASTPTTTSAPVTTQASTTKSPTQVQSTGQSTTTTSSSSASGNSNTALDSQKKATKSGGGGLSKTALAAIIIGSSVAGVLIIFTIIRKWKFAPSSRFDDRINPIDFGDSEPGFSSNLNLTSEKATAPSHDKNWEGFSVANSAEQHEKAMSEVGSNFGAPTATLNGGKAIDWPVVPIPSAHGTIRGPSNLARGDSWGSNGGQSRNLTGAPRNNVAGFERSMTPVQGFAPQQISYQSQQRSYDPYYRGGF